MKSITGAAILSFLGAAIPASAAPPAKRDVDTKYPYKGPETPVGDWVNNGVKSNGKGFPRLVEPPAVRPSSKNPKNNINVISVAYIPNGVNMCVYQMINFVLKAVLMLYSNFSHYQTPFAIGESPTVHWGDSESNLCHKAIGSTNTYVRKTQQYAHS